MAVPTSERRDRVLDAAARVFSQSGFARTSMDEIARDARVAKGTLYHVAESKEELYLLVVERETTAWHDASTQMIDPSISAEELILRIEGAGMMRVRSSPLLLDLFCGDTANMLGKWGDRFRNMRRMGRKNIVTILQLGIDQGIWRKDMDATAVGEVLQDLWLGLVVFEPPNFSFNARMARLAVVMDLLFNGLRTHAEAINDRREPMRRSA